MTGAVTVPTPVFVAQWVLLVGLGVLVIVMFRQLAYLMQISRNASADAGLAVGQKAPAFAYERARTTPPTAHTFEPVGAATILLFADPACPSCERAVSALGTLSERLSMNGLRVLIVTHAGDAMIDTFDAFRLSPVEIARADRDVAAHLFQTGVTPIFFAIDGDGVVRGKAIADRERDINELVSSLPGRVSEPRLRAREVDPVGVGANGKEQP